MGIVPKDLVDFHVHSNVSDGTHAPFELILQAQRNGVKMIALTDHDSIDGLDRFLGAAGRYRIHAVPGVEISSKMEGRRLHIVGLGLRRHLWHHLEEFLEQARAWRQERNTEILARLNELDMAVSMADVKVHCGGQIVARPHIARALVKGGYADSLQQAFEKYLGNGRPAYVPKRRPTPRDAVEVLHAAGALAIIAHPNSLVEANPEPLTPSLERLLEAGFDGIEAFHPDMSAAQSTEVVAFAEEHDLLLSGGSDFHGRNKPDNRLGRASGGRKLFAQQTAALVARFEPFERW